MAILTRDEAQAILKKALSFSRAEECTVSLGGSEGGNIRYARNSISTAGDVSQMSLAVNASFGKKSGLATINQFDDETLQKTVRRAEELAQLSPENPEHMPLLGPQNFPEAINFSQATAAMTPETRADAVAKSLQIAKEGKLESAGFLENSTDFDAMMNSKGLFAYNKSTDVSFSVTLRNQEGTGSGYVAKGYNDITKLDVVAATKAAAMKANGSAGARAIEPGKYTVILEPMAGSDIIRGMFSGFDARTAEEGRSYMSKKGGGTRLGEQLFDEKVTMYSDPMNPELPFSTFTGDGRLQKRTVWIEKGVVKTLAYSRYWAQKKGVESMPQANRMIMEGGTASLEDLIKNTEKGVLVTRFYYIRSVDAQSMLLTGLTRDGTFYIENGKIVYPIKNFRFNESPVIMLNNVEELGKPERSGGMLIPPMRIKDFTFSSLSDAV